MTEAGSSVFMELIPSIRVIYYPRGIDPDEEISSIELDVISLLYTEQDEDEPICHVPGTGYLKVAVTQAGDITRFLLIPISDCIPDLDALQNASLRFVYIGTDQKIIDRLRDEAVHRSEHFPNPPALPEEKAKRHRRDFFRGFLRVALNGWQKTSINERFRPKTTPKVRTKKKRRHK